MSTKRSLLLRIYSTLTEDQSWEEIEALLRQQERHSLDKKYQLFLSNLHKEIEKRNKEEVCSFIQRALHSCYSEKETLRAFEKNDALLTITTRFQLIEAMIDQLQGKKDPLPYPKDSLSECCHYVLTQLNNDLKKEKYDTERQTDGKIDTLLDTILEWITKTNTDNLFEKERIFVHQTCSEEPQYLLQHLAEKQQYYDTLPSNTSEKIPHGCVDFSFYTTMLQQGMVSNNTLAKSIKDQLKSEFLHRKKAYDTKRFQESRNILYDNLNQVHKKKKSRHNKFLKSFYDKRNVKLKQKDQDLIDSYKKIWEQDPSIKQLAESLGKRSKASVSYEKKIIQQEITEKIPIERPTSKGQISGIGQSNDLTSLIPTELLYRCNPRTKKLFDKRFIEKQLLSFQYENTLFVERKKIVKKEVSIAKIAQRGPIMLLVDTSGSMIGAGEKISKTITMALSHLALQEGRKCFLLFYSVNFTQLEIDHYDQEKLASFLRLTFEGGTDLNPAIEKVTDKMKEEKWKDADILVISDFIMENLVPRIQTKMALLQKKGTHFYSLSIGEDYNTSVLSLFDYNWAYDPQEKTIREMETLKKSEAKQKEEKRTFKRESASALYKV